MSSLDELIHSVALEIHEGNRQQAVQRRHMRDREAAASRMIETIVDRLLFHFPLTRREQRPDLSETGFKKLQQAELAHRNALLIRIADVLSSVEDGNNSFENRDLTF